MKKIIYIIGLLSSMSVSIGWVFKLLHFPGGGSMFNLGFLGFTLLFVPLLMSHQYNENLRKSWPEKLMIIFGFSSAVLTGLSVLFKLMHLQGADILLILGVIFFSLGFLPILFFKKYRKSME